MVTEGINGRSTTKGRWYNYFEGFRGIPNILKILIRFRKDSEDFKKIPKFLKIFRRFKKDSEIYEKILKISKRFRCFRFRRFREYTSAFWRLFSYTSRDSGREWVMSGRGHRGTCSTFTTSATSHIHPLHAQARCGRGSSPSGLLPFSTHNSQQVL